MRLFRRTLDLSHARVRRSAATDLTRASRLFRDGARRFQGFSGSELEPMLANAPGVVLEAGNELWGVALCSWQVAGTAWLRGFALVEGIELRPALDALLPLLHTLLRAEGVATLFYGGDDTADIWLQPALLERGYRHDTDVVVYEKRSLEVPDRGNQQVAIRPATPEDLTDVTVLDQRCFDAQWTKDGHILGPAISQGPLFMVAVLHGTIVGYAFATSHFGGRLIHLVRIAVDPQQRGQAIGVRLLAEVVAFAYREGADNLTLNTQSYNLQAQRLYRWFGFTLTGERQTILRYELRIEN